VKALILAAGLGTRLAPITDNVPKSLVPVNGKPIIFKQIENLMENDISDITIISGYKSDVLEKTVHEKWTNIRFARSINYADTNNMYSAYLGIKSMYGSGKIEPFIMMNADVFFDASVIKTLINCTASNAIVVDIGKYNEESMKVVEKEGRLVAISKKITEEDALGSSIDIYKFDSEGGKVFFDHCVKFIEKEKEVKLWSEVAINEALLEVKFTACPLNGRWFEIDDHDDLIAAELIFNEEKQ